MNASKPSKEAMETAKAFREARKRCDCDTCLALTLDAFAAEQVAKALEPTKTLYEEGLADGRAMARYER